MKILKLTIKKKYYNDIKLGKKKIEYREYKSYWIKRLIGKSYDMIEFKNGYKKDSPRMLVEYHGYVVINGAETPLGSMKQFAINLGKVIE